MWQGSNILENCNETKLYSRRNEDHSDFGECLLPFFQTALSSRLLSKHLNIEIYLKIKILPVVLYEHETWPDTLREE
jgi:hypothetical protein